ncbi:MAG: phosphoribosyl-AMP cyclohydrolase [Endozoicomonas sp.]
MVAESWLDEVNWNENGLVAAIAQDHLSGDVLMLAWMNRESLRLTLEEGISVYWSRSRGKLWRKGESSGHTQHLIECRLDCDGDAILLKVEQVGGIACHTGRKSCFYQRLDGKDAKGKEVSWNTVNPVLQDPKSIYG